MIRSRIKQQPLPPIAREDLLKEIAIARRSRNRRSASPVDDAIRQARRALNVDPDGTLDLLRNLLNRVERPSRSRVAVRDALSTRLQSSLRDSAAEVQRLKLRKQDQNTVAAQAQASLIRDQDANRSWKGGIAIPRLQEPHERRTLRRHKQMRSSTPWFRCRTRPGSRDTRSRR